MTDQLANVQDAVAFFKNAFTIIMALALGESLKQFVAERQAVEGDRAIHWDRLPGLLSFLFLIVPFYQGMSRYFYLSYGHPEKLSSYYSGYLAFDGVSLMAESALFFVMSRALAAVQWRRYYTCVFSLLIVDSFWIFVSNLLHSGPTQDWMFLNVAFAPVVAALLYMLKGVEPRVAAYVGMCAVIIRTALDYFFSWNTTYFPSLT